MKPGRAGPSCGSQDVRPPCGPAAPPDSSWRQQPRENCRRQRPQGGIHGADSRGARPMIGRTAGPCNNGPAPSRMPGRSTGKAAGSIRRGVAGDLLDRGDAERHAELLAPDVDFVVAGRVDRGRHAVLLGAGVAGQVAELRLGIVLAVLAEADLGVRRAVEGEVVGRGRPRCRCRSGRRRRRRW